MSYQEKKNIVNIFSAMLITAIYAWIIYQKHLAGTINLREDFTSWGMIFLIFIGVSIVARIVIYIIFHIINAIATRETDTPLEDERDKMVKLMSTRNSYYTFSVCVMSGFVLLAFGMPVYGMFIAFVISGLVSEIVENGSQIYYYRKGL